MRDRPAGVSAHAKVPSQSLAPENTGGEITDLKPGSKPANDAAVHENSTVKGPQKSDRGKGDSALTPRMGDTVRIHVDILDKLMLQAGELVLVRNQHLKHVDESDPVSRSLAHRLDIATTELQQTIINARMQPIGKVWENFPVIVRDLGRQLGKEIELEIKGSDAEVDRTILEALTDPLTHIIRNACSHGIETPEERLAVGKSRTGKITISSFHEAGRSRSKLVMTQGNRPGTMHSGGS